MSSSSSPSSPSPTPWLPLLQSIVNINSGTGNSSGCNAIRDLLIGPFCSLGFRSRRIDVGSGHQVLCFDVDGASPDLVFVGHIDTVFPPDSSFQKLVVSPNGDSLVGPGVIDMKGGVVLMLELLKALKSEGQIDLSLIRVLLNDDEEIGSPFSAETLKKLGTNVPFGLVFEPGLPDKSVVSSESGVMWVELDVKGQAAHAGLEHAKGVNAALELAHHLLKLNQLTNYEKKITCSIGTIEGGTRPNVVCDHAKAKIDIRYLKESDLNHAKQCLEDLKTHPVVKSPETGQTANTDFKILACVPSFPPESSALLLPMLQLAEKKTGQTIPAQHVSYASDANHLAQIGMNLLVGLGPHGGGMHCHHEFMLIKSFQERLDLGKELIREILKKRKRSENGK